jgi:hypothetical protein
MAKLTLLGMAMPGRKAFESKDFKERLCSGEWNIYRTLAENARNNSVGFSGRLFGVLSGALPVYRAPGAGAFRARAPFIRLGARPRPLYKLVV